MRASGVGQSRMFGKGLGFLLGRGQYCKHHRVSDTHVIEKSHGLDGRFLSSTKWL